MRHVIMTINCVVLKEKQKIKQKPAIHVCPPRFNILNWLNCLPSSTLLKIF